MTVTKFCDSDDKYSSLDVWTLCIVKNQVNCSGDIKDLYSI